jgi:sugar lactone lactonase YvrE
VVDDDDTVLIADCTNQRIMAWKKGDTKGHVVAGGQRGGNALHQLYNATDFVLEKETNDLIISDQGNQRVVRWTLNSDEPSEALIDNIACWGLAMDKQGGLYVSDKNRHEVRLYAREDTIGTVVAGGNGQGDGLNQLNYPFYMFVDDKQSLYVSDSQNHRVMKWVKGAKVGILVAGGHSKGEKLTQLSYPNGLWVDELGTVYVAEGGNDRVTRWSKGETSGVVVVGGNGCGSATNQLNFPEGLSFDCRGNMYVTDRKNHRVQKFILEKN